MGSKTPTGNWTRRTPRRQPWQETATVLFQPFGYRSLVKATNPTRRRQKDRAHQQALMMHDMIADIGRHPVYSAGVERDSPADRLYRRTAAKWIADNQSRFAVA